MTMRGPRKERGTVKMHADAYAGLAHGKPLRLSAAPSIGAYTFCMNQYFLKKNWVMAFPYLSLNILLIGVRENVKESHMKCDFKWFHLIKNQNILLPLRLPG